MKETAVPSSRTAGVIANVLWTAVLLIVAATPLIIDLAGRDVFRVPKSTFFQAAMIAVAGLAAASALLVDPFARIIFHNRRAIIIASLAVVWSALITLTAVVPAAARPAPLTMFCHAVLFVMTVALARNRGFLCAAAALLLPAVVNATMILLQAFRIWQPFVIAEGDDRLANIGLIGNPNMAGTYLLIPAVAALAATVAVRPYRLVSGGIALLLVLAIVQVQTISVLVALAPALLAVTFTAGRRVRLAAVALIAAGLLASLASPSIRQRVGTLRSDLARGEYAALTSGRIPAAATALHMFKERPLFGVGPGGFAARYMPYRLRVEEEHPQWMEDVHLNFGEAHNDHAQLLAETGLPGYVLFLFFLFSVARVARSPRTDSDHGTLFAHRFALPAVIAFAIVAFGQFPLELTACTSSSVFAAGLCVAWSADAVS